MVGLFSSRVTWTLISMKQSDCMYHRIHLLIVMEWNKLSAREVTCFMGLVMRQVRFYCGLLWRF